MLNPFTNQRRQRALGLAMGGLAAAAGLFGLSLVVQSLRDSGPLVLQPQGQRAPQPPAQAPWISPLSRQCSMGHSEGDRALRQRLLSLQRSLPQRMEQLRIDPSNYAARLGRDAYGNRLDTNPSMVVLHETVYGLSSAVNTFTTYHPHDTDQVSYHLLLGEHGRVVQAVDPSQRAFGAGYSAFQGRWVITNPSMAGSVNNFALHLSLETPLDGEDSEPGHSGYTTIQYDNLAVVLADWMRRYRIPFEAITTHRHVDLGLERADPRSFDWSALQRRLAALGALC
jgi:N-acetyl-anhydromuramyl-L-alanine amidase AmpD